MITRQNLSELMSFNPDQYLTTTLYLQIDGSPQAGYTIELKDLLKQAKKDLDSLETNVEVRKSAEADLKKISDFVNLEFSKEGVRTLIVFSCSAKRWWKMFTLNMSLRSRLIVNSKPNLRPLIFLLDQYSHFLVILIERSRARLFEFYAGEMMEHTDILDEVPGRVNTGGYGGYEERRIERHIEDHVRRHFKHVAETAFELFRKHQNDYIILLGTEQNVSDFRHCLNGNLQERVVASEHEELNVSTKVLLEKVMRIERHLKEKQERQFLERLFNQVNSGGLGVLGLDSTIRALQQGQVNFLLIQQGYEKEGYRCIECRRLQTNNGSCDYCGGKTQTVHDVVEEVVQDALTQGCQVKYITVPDSQLASAGGIGAILRYKT